MRRIVMIERIQLSKEAVAERAYELYLQGGSQPGRDVEDWVRAEKELSGAVVVGSVKAKATQARRTETN
jgi:hypothetical protein